MMNKNFTTNHPQQYSGFCLLEDAMIHYNIAGNNTNAIVLIHGFGLDMRMWDEQFSILSETNYVLRYDARGFGQSSLPDGAPYTHADDLRALLDFFQIENATVIGLSMGGGIAVNFTLTFPERVRKLILVDSALRDYQWSQKWNTLWKSLETVAREQGLQAANELWFAHPIFASAREKPNVMKHLRQMILDYSGWHWTNQDTHRPTLKPDISRLGEINAPTLILIGEYDLPDFHRIADILHRNISKARKILIPSVGHMANMENPNLFYKTILPFITS